MDKLVLALLAMLIAAFPVWILWNWLVPELFGLKVISFWQAIGLTMLCHILFKSRFFTNKAN